MILILPVLITLARLPTVLYEATPFAISSSVSLLFYAAAGYVFGLVDIDFFKTKVKTNAQTKRRTDKTANKTAKNDSIACKKSLKDV